MKVILLSILFCLGLLFGCGDDDKKEAGSSAEKPTQAELSAEAKAIKQAQAEVEDEIKNPTNGGDSDTATFISICNRTAQVWQAILKRLYKPATADHCDRVTPKELLAIQFLILNDKGITNLKVDDFQGLSSLGWLSLRNNQLSSYPPGLFQGLSSLKRLDLRDNDQLSPAVKDQVRKEVGDGVYIAF